MVLNAFMSSREKAACQREIRVTIGRQLRAFYDRQLSEPVPDRLADLVERLGSRETGASAQPQRDQLAMQRPAMRRATRSHRQAHGGR